MDATDYIFFAVILGVVAIGAGRTLQELRRDREFGHRAQQHAVSTGAPLPAKFLGVLSEPSREMPQVRRLLVGSALFLVFWFPSRLVADLVSWSSLNVGRPLAWAMVCTAVVAMLIGAAARRLSGKGIELAVALALGSLVAASWVLVTAFGNPSGVNRPQVVQFLGWTSVVVLGLGLLLRYRYLIGSADSPGKHPGLPPNPSFQRTRPKAPRR